MSKSERKPAKLEFEATGTLWRIESELEIDHQLEIRVGDFILDFEAYFSRFKDDSIVLKMAEAAGTYHFPEYSRDMFQLLRDLEQLSEGVFTPLIGKSLNEAGYDKNYTLKPGRLTENSRLSEKVSIEGSTLRTNAPVELDFGAIAKGLLVDQLASLLIEAGHKEITINAGGDIYTTRQQVVGLENPDKLGSFVGKIGLSHGSICSSSGNRRDWGAFNHIIDARELKSPTNIKASWVTADNAMLADALATALHLVEPGKLKQFSFEYAIIDANGEFLKSSGFGGG